ncbi:cation-translocating P-type ATPase ['Camptotheca acuminata' phytoplasma]|uniref:cation-translocating P-type ATPase n=1 Tax='Camptotheca acuminata' phytoplasma TaxID=3239192 RepID=UPI00351A7683
MENKELLEISSLSLEEAFKRYDTNYEGLDDEEVQKRYSKYGLNFIKSGKKFNFVKQIVKQFTSMFAILLLVSGTLAFIIKEKEIGIAILTVIFINGIFSFIQEYKAEKILSSLGDMIPKKIQVYRNNKVEFIDVINLTIGDIIFLDAGAVVPADARIIEANDFYVDNSILTGETVPLNRTAEINKNDNDVVAEIPNLVFAGATVTQGSAKAIVYSIAENTQIGEISNLSEEIDKGISTLEKEIHKVIKVISTIALSLTLVVFIICLWRFPRDDRYWMGAITVSLGMLVANIPEGLLPTINLSLAIGSQRMAKKKALIKKLFFVETLNSATVICTDKTGTLTENKLTCTKVLFNGGSADITGNGFEKEGQFTNFNKKRDDKVLKKMLIAASVCSETNIVDDENDKSKLQIIGNAAEGALLIAARKYGFQKDNVVNNFDVEKIVPFSSENKKMSVLVKNISQDSYDLNEKYVFIKGAPSIILNDSIYKYDHDKVSPFTQAEKDAFIKQNEELSIKGYRMLGIAYKKIDSVEKNYEEKDLVFLGFFVNYDPPKMEVYGAVKKLYKAGLKITVITGDYGPTAVSIGRQVGIIENDEYLDINGTKIDQMSQEELQESLKTTVPIFFSRTTPKHKLRITQAYRSNGEIVGVIGDGINDILAMKEAHIGIAMGKSGKDVTRNAADIILLDDNFSTIPNALLEARGIYDNIKKFITYVFSSNIPQIFPIIFMALFNVPLYLTVMQILAIDLVTDLIPAIALGAEKPKKELLEQKPITKDDHLLDKKVLKRSYGFLGIVEGILGLVFFLTFYGTTLLSDVKSAAIAGTLKKFASEDRFLLASTMAFGAVIFSQIGNVFACRSDKRYFWSKDNKRNKLLYFGILCELIFFVLVTVSFEGLRKTFGTIDLGFIHYLSLISCILVVLLFDTLYKFINNKRQKNKIIYKIYE